MATVTLTAKNFQPTIAGSPIVFVDFLAPWCGPCRQFAPVYEKAAAAHPDIVFAKVDTEAERALAATAHITAIPTLMAFRDGTVVYSQPGALTPPALDRLISSVRSLSPTARPNAAGPRLAGT